MIRDQSAGALHYLVADTLLDVPHCFSTRLGGVSSNPYDSLNLGLHRGDDPDCVRENYRRLGRAVGFRPEQTVFTHQIHTDIVREVGRDDWGVGLYTDPAPDCDALITNTPGTALVCFSADCTPILLYDPVHHAIAAVHSGWRGTALGIVQKAVEAMTRAFGTHPLEVRAAIGPCISRCCFETDYDVPGAMIHALGDAGAEAVEQVGRDKYHVDLKLLNKTWLLRAGLRPANIDISPLCTACRQDLFWSHRRVGNERGSLAAVIALPEEKKERFV